MAMRGIGAALGVLAMLSGCGGGGSDSAGSGSIVTGPGTPPTSPSATCSLKARQDWVAGQLREWYLFADTLPASLDPAPYRTVDDYIDALTATARSQGRDRYFTYLTSIAEEDAYYQSGSSAGFGFRLLYDTSAGRVYVAESYEGTPALNGGVDRGAEIVAIGTSTANLRTVSDIMASGGAQGVIDALGPSTVGTARVLRIANASGTRTVTLTKTDYSLTPVSSRYGARILDDGGRKVGYVNLRTFIDTADPSLRAAFQGFRTAGVTEIIVDLRYNGGGLVSIGELLGDLMGGNRFTSDIFSYTSFRPEKSAYNETRNFQPQAQSIAPTRVAFIGTGGTASASEMVINAFIPYLRANAALIGTNTYGKPVGQIALDRSACDDRLRVIAFAVENAARNADYFGGLAGSMDASCRAPDDLTHPLGDPQEASIRQALDFLAGRSCTRVTTGRSARAVATTAPRELLSPLRPDTTQRETPGTF